MATDSQFNQEQDFDILKGAAFLSIIFIHVEDSSFEVANPKLQKVKILEIKALKGKRSTISHKMQ